MEEVWVSKDGRISVAVGDITAVKADAIVNAANSRLLGGGGVDGAIHAAGGQAILEECRALRAGSLRAGLPSGEAVATTAGKLKARYVIHTVGPVWQGGSSGEAALLASCYRKSLELAGRLGCSDLVFPSISTGAYGYPAGKADLIAFSEIQSHLGSNGLPRKVVLIFRDGERAGLFLAANGL